jgi:hypothetical protein
MKRNARKFETILLGIRKKKGGKKEEKSHSTVFTQFERDRRRYEEGRRGKED